MEKLNIYQKLSEIQNELKAPKSNRNTFGNYNYRSAEDILEAAKPICKKHNTTLVLSDELQNIGDRYYIKATAKLIDHEAISSIEVSAYAREEETKKGMDGSQITGTASSYARKYALNGLFNIDDTKDADTDEYTKRTKDELSPKQIQDFMDLVVDTETDLDKLKEYYKVVDIRELSSKQYNEALNKMKKKVDQHEGI